MEGGERPPFSFEALQPVHVKLSTGLGSTGYETQYGTVLTAQATGLYDVVLGSGSVRRNVQAKHLAPA